MKFRGQLQGAAVLLCEKEWQRGVRGVVGRVSTQLKTFYDPRLVVAVG